ncbi:hypothetical protein CC80DRAFT_578743 [Byssothecium circinans]|uniref:Uncharacterized protein n=1 Tax=Byssothecium circinans TaxID=147558 RepID=A0A6A5TD47_9PLEO|nr:hypothetical protein CC80DRAFT_578743 [Byssothecium circinans]
MSLGPKKEVISLNELLAYAGIRGLPAFNLVSNPNAYTTEARTVNEDGTIRQINLVQIGPLLYTGANGSDFRYYRDVGEDVLVQAFNILNEQLKQPFRIVHFVASISNVPLRKASIRLKVFCEFVLMLKGLGDGVVNDTFEDKLTLFGEACELAARYMTTEARLIKQNMGKQKLVGNKSTEPQEESDQPKKPEYSLDEVKAHAAERFLESFNAVSDPASYTFENRRLLPASKGQEGGSAKNAEEVSADVLLVGYFGNMKRKTPVYARNNIIINAAERKLGAIYELKLYQGQDGAPLQELVRPWYEMSTIRFWPPYRTVGKTPQSSVLLNLDHLEHQAKRGTAMLSAFIELAFMLGGKKDKMHNMRNYEVLSLLEEACNEALPVLIRNARSRRSHRSKGTVSGDKNVATSSVVKTVKGQKRRRDESPNATKSPVRKQPRQISPGEWRPGPNPDVEFDSGLTSNLPPHFLQSSEEQAPLPAGPQPAPQPQNTPVRQSYAFSPNIAPGRPQPSRITQKLDRLNLSVASQQSMHPRPSFREQPDPSPFGPEQPHASIRPQAQGFPTIPSGDDALTPQAHVQYINALYDKAQKYDAIKHINIAELQSKAAKFDTYKGLNVEELQEQARKFKLTEHLNIPELHWKARRYDEFTSKYSDPEDQLRKMEEKAIEDGAKFKQEIEEQKQLVQDAERREQEEKIRAKRGEKLFLDQQKIAQTEKARADQEKARADQEHARAEAAEKQLENEKSRIETAEIQAQKEKARAEEAEKKLAQGMAPTINQEAFDTEKKRAEAVEALAGPEAARVITAEARANAATAQAAKLQTQLNAANAEVAKLKGFRKSMLDLVNKA